MDKLDLEFAYTAYADSCKDLYAPGILCRRPANHEPEWEHAAGFGKDRVRWKALRDEKGQLSKIVTIVIKV